MRQTPKQNAGQRASHPRTRWADPDPIRFIALTMVALVGVAAGAVIGAAAYRFEQPAAPETARERAENMVSETASRPKQQKPGPQAAKAKTKKRPQQAAGVTVVTPTPFKPETGATTNDQRQKTANILTVASIIRHAEETRPAALSATSARFGETGSKPAVVDDRLSSSPQEETRAIDNELTGSIASPPDEQPASGSSSEIDEMQSRLSKQNAEHFAHPADTVAAAAIAKGMRMNQAVKYVSLRALPDKTSAELAVVPAGAELLAETNCDRWCGAVYQGQDGYIYYTYLRVLEQQSDDVEIAETEAEVQAIEARMAAQDKEHFLIPTAPVARTGSPLRQGWTTKYVNLRAGPDNQSDILMFVPANASVLAEENCLHWCRAIYDGREGFIYKSFVRREQASSG